MSLQESAFFSGLLWRGLRIMSGGWLLHAMVCKKPAFHVRTGADAKIQMSKTTVTAVHVTAVPKSATAGASSKLRFQAISEGVQKQTLGSGHLGRVGVKRLKNLVWPSKHRDNKHSGGISQENCWEIPEIPGAQKV